MMVSITSTSSVGLYALIILSLDMYIVDNVSAVAVAPEETTSDKGMDVGEGIDTSILTGDIMTRIKVPF
jgi:hypothetical protein